MSFENLNLFEHLVAGEGKPKTLFLFHGTGGDERDLLPVVERLKDEYSMVSLRGNVEEQGMARFFKRVGMGEFDQASIREETGKLRWFLEAWYEKYELTFDRVSFLGYSNGANMILATLFRFPILVPRAVLLHPMLPFEPEEVELEGKRFLVTMGQNDLMISAEESERAIEVLDERGAEVTVVRHEGGHEIWEEEVVALEEFLQEEV